MAQTANKKSGRRRVAARANKNFRARIIYRTAEPYELLLVAESTNVFENMRNGYFDYLTNGSPTGGKYSVGGGSTIVINWTEVISFHDWID